MNACQKQIESTHGQQWLELDRDAVGDTRAAGGEVLSDDNLVTLTNGHNLPLKRLASGAGKRLDSRLDIARVKVKLVGRTVEAQTTEPKVALIARRGGVDVGEQRAEDVHDLRALDLVSAAQPTGGNMCFARAGCR